MSREKLEIAVNRVGKAFGELLKVFEVSGSTITESERVKAFTYLTNAFNTIQTKSESAHQLSTITKGTFSLDMEIAQQEPQPSLSGVRSGVVIGVTGRPEGRISKHSGEAVNQPIILPDDDDISFIEE